MTITQFPIFTADRITRESCASHVVPLTEWFDSSTAIDEAGIRRILVKCTIKPA